LRENCVLIHVFEGKIEGKRRGRRRRRRRRQLLDDLKEKRSSSSHWKKLWTCRKTDSKMNGRKTLRKPVAINTVVSPEDGAAGLSYLSTAILR
jgi:hypothetical protein